MQLSDTIKAGAKATAGKALDREEAWVERRLGEVKREDELNRGLQLIWFIFHLLLSFIDYM